MSGEDIRGRLYLTQRRRRAPNLPAAGIHDPRLPGLSRLARGRPAGQLFLSRAGVPRCAGRRRASSCRPGIESFGRADREAADAEILAVALEAAAARHRRRLADAASATPACSRALLDALDAPAVHGCAASRRGLAQGKPLAAHPRRAARRPRSIIPACSPRSPASTRRARGRWSRICWRSPASPRSAAAPPARSPTASSSRRRCRAAPACRPRSAPGAGALPGDRRRSGQRLGARCARSSPTPSSPLDAALDALRRSGSASSPRAASISARSRFAARLRAQPRLLHRLRLRGARRGAAGDRADRRRRPLRPAAARRSAPATTFPPSARRSGATDSPARETRNEHGQRPSSSPSRPRAGCRRTPPPSSPAPGSKLVAGPRRARLSRHARRHRRRRGGLSVGLRDRRAARRRRRRIWASPARTSCARRSPTPTASVELLTPLGFGHANVVVAVPQAWIDVRTMADLEDVAAAFRARRGERMRVATKYVNLTRRFFAEQRRQRLSHRREPRRDRGRAGGRAGRAHRRHHDDRRDARRQRAQGARRRHDPALGGQSRRLAAGPTGPAMRGERARHPCRASRRKKKRARRAKWPRPSWSRRRTSRYDQRHIRRPRAATAADGHLVAQVPGIACRSSPTGSSCRAPKA